MKSPLAITSFVGDKLCCHVVPRNFSGYRSGKGSLDRVVSSSASLWISSSQSTCASVCPEKHMAQPAQACPVYLLGCVEERKEGRGGRQGGP